MSGLFSDRYLLILSNIFRFLLFARYRVKRHSFFLIFIRKCRTCKFFSFIFGKYYLSISKVLNLNIGIELRFKRTHSTCMKIRKFRFFLFI